jgi:hypothetical protein
MKKKGGNIYPLVAGGQQLLQVPSPGIRMLLCAMKS